MAFEIRDIDYDGPSGFEALDTDALEQQRLETRNELKRLQAKIYGRDGLESYVEEYGIDDASLYRGVEESTLTDLRHDLELDGPQLEDFRMGEELPEMISYNEEPYLESSEFDLNRDETYFDYLPGLIRNRIDVESLFGNEEYEDGPAEMADKIQFTTMTPREEYEMRNLISISEEDFAEEIPEVEVVYNTEGYEQARMEHDLRVRESLQEAKELNRPVRRLELEANRALAEVQSDEIMDTMDVSHLEAELLLRVVDSIPGIEREDVRRLTEAQQRSVLDLFRRTLALKDKNFELEIKMTRGSRAVESVYNKYFGDSFEVDPGSVDVFFNTLREGNVMRDLTEVLGRSISVLGRVNEARERLNEIRPIDISQDREKIRIETGLDSSAREVVEGFEVESDLIGLETAIDVLEQSVEDYFRDLYLIATQLGLNLGQDFSSLNSNDHELLLSSIKAALWNSREDWNTLAESSPFFEEDPISSRFLEMSGAEVYMVLENLRQLVQVDLPEDDELIQAFVPEVRDGLPEIELDSTEEEDLVLASELEDEPEPLFGDSLVDVQAEEYVRERVSEEGQDLVEDAPVEGPSYFLEAETRLTETERLRDEFWREHCFVGYAENLTRSVQIEYDQALLSYKALEQSREEGDVELEDVRGEIARIELEHLPGISDNILESYKDLLLDYEEAQRDLEDQRRRQIQAS